METGGGDFGEYLRPDLERRLAAVGMAVAYHRARGDYLYREEAGEEIEVLDLVAGFGASLLGHNHPEVVAASRRALDEERPFLAQGSVRTEAGRLARRLSESIGRTTGRSYRITLANSGAEAVEAALKHAEMERRRRIERHLRRMRRTFAEVEERLATGTARIPRGFLTSAKEEFDLGAPGTLDELFVVLEARLLELRERPPVALALEGAFHGKTLGALQLTHNSRLRGPWRSLGPKVRFLRTDAPERVNDVLREERLTRVAVELEEDGTVGLVSHGFVNVLACFAEPIRGEGGVRPVPDEFLEALRAAADVGGFPLVFDEIQSGLGRTGTLLASEPSNVRADYYTLAKALGGGLAKISALVIDRERYVDGFDYLHTSTYADDHHASAVANATLDRIERDDGELLATCREKGSHLMERLRRLQEDVPDVVAEVRGRGLFVGVELVSQESSSSPLLRVLSEQDRLGLIVCAHLLGEARIRVLPTLSSGATLRIQPSAFIERAELDRFCDALRRALVAVRDGDAYRLIRHTVADHPVREAEDPGGEEEESRSSPAPVVGRGSEAEGSDGHVGFLGHFVEPADLRRWDRTLAPLSDDACDRFLRRIRGTVDPFVADRGVVRSVTGSSVTATTIALPCSTAQAEEAMRSGEDAWLQEWIDDAVELARDLGCTVLGFGGYASIATGNCRSVYAPDMAVTTGNALTSAAALQATMAMADRLGFETRRMGIVGATGNVGRALAEAAAPEVDEIVLIGRPGAASRLQAIADGMGAHGRVRVGEGMEELSGCNMIISATNSARPIILPQHVSPTGPVVLTDVALPGDVDPRVAEERSEARILKGGVIRAPLGQELRTGGLGPGAGRLYACLAETLVLGLEGVRESLSRGPLRAEVIHRARDLAERHGFSLDDPIEP